MHGNVGNTDGHKYQKDKMFNAPSDDRAWKQRKRAHAHKRRQNHRAEIKKCMLNPEHEFRPSQYVNDWIW